MIGNGTVYPSLQLASFQADGFGGIRLSVKTSSGATEVKPVPPGVAAIMLAQLSAVLAETLKTRDAA